MVEVPTRPPAPPPSIQAGTSPSSPVAGGSWVHLARHTLGFNAHSGFTFGKATPLTLGGPAV
ncbi:hypothetical protein E2C01_092389 [Portunus trituberculatus]|uniref:Uncharacterized protein n=1 Tax=Portunus trituberculatus TaxID=210409 RepID=A0A5B7JVC0_PORTR|nr:hypothetical protein [Portunus trituberculatus]